MGTGESLGIVPDLERGLTSGTVPLGPWTVEKNIVVKCADLGRSPRCVIKGEKQDPEW